MTGPKIMFTIPLLGGIPVTETVTNSWMLMAFLVIVSILLTRNLQKIPKGTQVLVEKAVLMLRNFVETTMGSHNVHFMPYIGTLFLFSLFGNMMGMIGLRPPTADLNTTAGWALIMFMMIQIISVKRKGIKARLKSFAEPVPVMVPMNLISEVSTPVSVAFRHFGNIAAGVVITSLLYTALAGLSTLVFNFLHLDFLAGIPLLQLGLPAVLSIYFDLFTAFMQAFIISMLTMVFTSMAID